MTITITDGRITACEFHTFEEDGTPKDEKYGTHDGAITNQDWYNKAQKAVAACAEYAAQLVETGSVNEVDAISGASKNYTQFQEAVRNALKQAKG